MSLTRAATLLSLGAAALIVGTAAAGALRLDLGDIAIVWNWPAFIFAALTGFVFGFGAGLIADGRCSEDRSPLAYGWIAGTIAAIFVSALVGSQVCASIAVGDVQADRVLSRLGPFIAGAVNVGIGVFVALQLRREKEEK